MTEPSSEIPANKPLLREYAKTPDRRSTSVPTSAFRPTGPAVADASAPSFSFPFRRPFMPLSSVNNLLKDTTGFSSLYWISSLNGADQCGDVGAKPIEQHGLGQT